MPFEFEQGARRRIAVIGAGISGMGAAYFLAADHDVTLIEAAPRLGGHSRTITAGKRGDQPVDTGFIVFNRVNYPHLTRLFQDLEVPIAPSSMSFGVSIDGGRVEYGLKTLNAIFAQRRNLVRPAYLRMVRDILHFFKHAEARVAHHPDMTIGALVAELGLGDWFRKYYLAPFSGAIWSTPPDQIMAFPAHAMVTFFKNHALMSPSGQHQWYTVRGGSIEYVTRLETALRAKGVAIRSAAPVQGVRRTFGGVQIKLERADWEQFDEVIFATHSDDTLRMLVDPTDAEHQILGAIRYQPNTVTLHADPSVMPKRRLCWASWVYAEDKSAPNDRIDLTYWMNSLQPIPMDDPHFVTLNTNRRIREDLIYDQTVLRHPVYDLGALAAQRKMTAINGRHATWYCGAWMKNGFHEDGLSSALDVATAIRARSPLGQAAE